MRQLEAKDVRVGMVLRNEMDCVSAEVTEFKSNRNQWANGFWLWFNCAVVHSAKTKKGLVGKLNQLVRDHDLELVEDEEE